MTDRERYLKVANPDEWDRWLSWKADVYAPNRGLDDNDDNDDCKTNFYEPGMCKSCLFCIAFDDNCRLCMGDDACLGIHRNERIDRAIEKLEKAGVFEE